MSSSTAAARRSHPELFSVERTATPFLKWAGGKQQLLPVLLPLVPSAWSMYWEPFLGGGAMFFGVAPRVAKLSDANEELIECYMAVRDSVEDVMSALKRHKNDESYFYKLRETSPNGLSTAERAARLIYLNRTCYNGLYRVNRRGEFNVPFGRYSKPVICQEEVLRRASVALQATELVAGDFRGLLSRPKSGDFIYLDPPYIPIGEYSDFRRYHRVFFSLDDHRDLAESFRELDQKGCLVMLSNSDTPLVHELYSRWKITRVWARRSINSKGDRRQPIAEVLVTNY